MEDQKYNGWTNYETWLVKLWIDNDQGMQETALDMATNAVANPEPNEFADGGHLSPAYSLERSLREWVEWFDEIPETGMISDLIGAALSRVNWRELAEAYIDDAAEIRG